jgi:hypothetical protein
MESTMEVTNLEEHDDGSAAVEIELTKDEVQYLIQYALTDIIKTTAAEAPWDE